MSNQQIKALCLDSGILQCGGGIFTLTPDERRPQVIKTKQFTNLYLNVLAPISAAIVAVQVFDFLKGHVPDVLIYEHNQMVSTTVVYLIGSVIFMCKLKNPDIIIKKYNAASIKKECLGHTGQKYNGKVKGKNGKDKREFSKSKKREEMKKEMVRWVNQTYGIDLSYDNHDEADTYAFAWTYWKREMNGGKNGK